MGGIVLSWDDRRTIAKISTLYYFEGWTQAQIAKKYNVSRPVISKVLQKAKDEGIIEIYIKDENIHNIELERNLEKKFGLKEAIVVSSQNLSEEMLRKTVGLASASYVKQLIDRHPRIGISWGTTIASVVEEFPYIKKENAYIVPLVGGMGSKAVEVHVNQLVYELSKKISANCTYLYAPAMVETKELRDRLIESEDIKTVLNEGALVDMAIVGIGTPYSHSTMKEIGYLTESEIEELENHQVVGDISSNFFKVNGSEQSIPLNDRVIGINLEQLKQIETVIGIAYGEYKGESIYAALENKYINVLITDDAAAKKILAQ